jgi:hypothetical protein
MDIGLLVLQVARSLPDVLSVEESNVDDGGDKSSKAETIRQREGRAEVEGRIRLVRLLVEGNILVEDPGGVIRVAEVVEVGVGTARPC